MKLIILFCCVMVCLASNPKAQESRFQYLLSRASKNLNYPSSFVPESIGASHKNVSNVVFAAAMGDGWMPRNAKVFAGTLRKTGYDGDIVIAIDDMTNKDFLKTLASFNCIIYNIQSECEGQHLSKRCKIKGYEGEAVSVNMVRYLLYMWWSTKYSADTTILVSDFRDVLFQSNPFEYMPDQWAPPRAHLTFFLEALPQKMIYRCAYNSGWIINCYGNEAYELIKSNPVSCSGVSFGSRDAIIIYSFMLLEQIDPLTRAKYGIRGVVPNSTACLSMGMDQGFHNWLLFSGKLQRSMNVKVFQQGEGPANTVGSFYPGHQALLKLTLDEQWGILKGKAPNRYVANWNGDVSPMTHQLDRFDPFLFDMGKELACLQGVVQN